jgi:hypothetical protein
MVNPFASGKHALGLCDICGQRYKLTELFAEIYNQRPTGFLVCEECFDEDHPQLQLGRFPIIDPQALRNPRPDAGVDSSRALWGWHPIGNASTQALCKVGLVSINGLLTTWRP